MDRKEQEMSRIDEQGKAKAVELAGELVRHQLNRVRDCLDRAEGLLDASTLTNPDEALAEINRAANIAGRAQQASQMWKGLVIDWQKSKPGALASS
jgi:hypothetical protein